MKPLWIELAETGVGNRYEFEDEEVIEMNWRLTLYPELYRKVLDHELAHDDGTYNMRDMLHDFKSRTPGLFHFMRNHLSSWTQILPIYYSTRHKQIIYDINTIISWVILFAVCGSVYMLLTLIGSLL